MATVNPFDLLGDDDNDDPSQLIAVQQQKMAPQAQSQVQHPKPAKLPAKPLPPAQAVREAKNEPGRGGGRGGGRGYGRGRGGGGFNRDLANENSFSNTGFSGGQAALDEPDSGKPSERRGGYGGPRSSFRGGRRGGFNNEEGGDVERPRRVFERRSGTGRGNEFKREGAGRGNWGTPTDEIAQVTEEVTNESENNMGAEKASGEEDATDANKENPANEEAEEKELEDKEMTLQEYEKVLEEKRKALQALKTEERKVAVDKELAAMQQLSNKKGSDDVFVKLGSDKDKRKEFAEKDDKSKKSVSINEFLKPVEGERYYGGRGRGRGRGSRGGGSAGFSSTSNAATPKIEDPGQFPTLGAK